jgi:hypothetical protein
MGTQMVAVEVAIARSTQPTHEHSDHSHGDSKKDNRDAAGQQMRPRSKQIGAETVAPPAGPRVTYW